MLRKLRKLGLYDVVKSPFIQGIQTVEIMHKLKDDNATFKYKEEDEMLRVNNIHISCDDIREKFIDTVLDILNNLKLKVLYIESDGNIPFLEDYLVEKKFKVEKMRYNTIRASRI